MRGTAEENINNICIYIYINKTFFSIVAGRTLDGNNDASFFYPSSTKVRARQV